MGETKPNYRLRREQIIHALAPYIAVLIGLYIFRNAWFTILLYHLQILICARFFKTDIRKLLFSGYSGKYLSIFALPGLLFGPILLMVFPYILRENIVIREWLYDRGLAYQSFLILVPYFCIIHPLLEEIHWGKFRDQARGHWMMHCLFAGYHLLVLATLVKPLWLIIAFFILSAVSYLWTVLCKRLKGGAIPFWSHLIGDVGAIWATYRFVFK